MSKNLTIDDNLNMNIKIISKIVVDGAGTPVSPLKFNNNLKVKLSGILIINSYGNTFPTSQPFMSFSETSKVVTVNNIAGLVAGQEYTLTVLMIGN